MIPSIKDFAMYVNKKLTEIDWNNNWQKVVNLFTSGQADVNFKSVEISQDGGLVNNGSFTQNGNLTVGGNAEITGNLQVNGTLSGDGSGLTGVISSAQISYTPFCVNSGNLDVNGKGDLIRTDGVQTSIQFKVDDGTSYKPITFTNAKGKTTTLNAINSYDLSQTDNGTYIVYITENATAVTLTDKDAKIYRQPSAPSNPSGTDIWFDTSSEGLKSYIRQSGTWVDANIVPLGTVTVANHQINSATTFIYNWNGYNVNIGDCINLQKNQYPIVCVQSYELNGTWYMIFSNGWVFQGGITESGASGNRYITLPIEMKYDNYCITLSAGIGSSSGSTNNTVEDITTTGFKIWSGSPSYYTWQVSGKMK